MFAAICLGGINATAQAQLTLIFNPTTFPAALPGQLLTIQATLTNLTGEIVDLDVGTAGGSIIGPGAPGLTWDDADFVINLPDFLADGASYNANLYLNVEAIAPVGDYTATYELVGIGRTTATSYDASAFALITVIDPGGGGGGEIIPEPSPVALIGLGGSLLLIKRRGKKG